MKTRFYNILLPKFLRNFDDYVLRHYPVVWRTKAVFVLYYGLVGAVLLFAAGFFYPVDAQQLTVAPDKPIEMGYDSYHLYCVGLITIGILYWAYQQYQLGFPFTKMKDTLLTLALYTLCFYVLFALTTPAFRLGTIYKTAYCWIDSTELKRLEQSGIYPYGFVLLQEDRDKDFTKVTLTDTFFQRREAIFKSIYDIEDILLSHRYRNDSTFWKHWIDIHPHLDEDDLNIYFSNQSDLSYRSDISDLSDISDQFDQWNISDRLDRSDQLYRSGLSDLSYRSYRSDQLDRSDQSDQSYRSYRSDQPYRSDQSSWSSLSLYNTYKNKMNQGFYIGSNPYNFLNTQDSTHFVIYELNYDILIVYCPRLPYSVEDAVRSVKHAQLYVQEKIYTRHGYGVLSYVLILSLLLYFVPFLSVRHLFSLLIVCIVAAVIIAFKLPKELTETIEKNIYNAAYLIIPVLSCLWLLVSVLKKQEIKGFTWATQGVFVGLLLVLIGALFIIYRVKADFNDIESFQPPYDLAFYGVQILGVLGAVLTTYVRTLPKQ